MKMSSSEFHARSQGHTSNYDQEHQKGAGLEGLVRGPQREIVGLMRKRGHSTVQQTALHMVLEWRRLGHSRHRAASKMYLASGSHILSSKHGSVWTALISVRLYFHAPCYSAQCFLPTQVCHVHKCIIEGSENVCNSEDHLSFSCSRTQADILFHLWGLLGRHDDSMNHSLNPLPTKKTEHSPISWPSSGNSLAHRFLHVCQRSRLFGSGLWASADLDMDLSAVGDSEHPEDPFGLRVG